MDKVESKDLEIKMSHSNTSGNFFVDFWDGDKYIVSIKLTENQAINISNNLGIKILE